MKIQNDKQYLFPDPFMMDWDSLSENELKRLVAQLEKTRNDVLLDLREAQLRLVTMTIHFYTNFNFVIYFNNLLITTVSLDGVDLFIKV
jgi:hypothetical protein